MAGIYPEIGPYAPNQSRVYLYVPNTLRKYGKPGGIPSLLLHKVHTATEYGIIREPVKALDYFAEQIK